jgi:hypothetical protein
MSAMIDEGPDPAVSMGKRIGFWAFAVMAFLTGLATLFWALDYLVVQSANANRSSQFLGVFGAQALLWGFLLIRHRRWRKA